MYILQKFLVSKSTNISDDFIQAKFHKKCKKTIDTTEKFCYNFIKIPRCLFVAFSFYTVQIREGHHVAKHYTKEQINEMSRKLLISSAELFITKGYSATTLQQIGDKAGIDKWTLLRIFGSKENILAALVKFVLNEQFEHTEAFIKDKTDDKILFYATETILQLHIVESSENIRELYTAAYSLPNTTEIIQETLTNKLEFIFKEHLPNYDTTNFYMLEIASGGIMRGFMTIPCSMLLTMERKITAFLETTFSVYKVPEEKVKEAIDFVKQYDFKKIAAETVQSMLNKITEQQI